jgi:hypothetical protein
MKNKHVKMLSLLGADASPDDSADLNAHVESVLKDSAGHVLRLSTLRSRRIDYDVADKRVEVNGSGEMLAYQSTTRPDSGAAETSLAGESGKTVISWKKQFNYDEATRITQFDGLIHVLHEEIGAKTPNVHLTCEEVRAEFASAPSSQGQGEGSAQLHLRSVIASGNVEVATPDNTVKNCATMEFDPATSILICRAEPGSQVAIIDNKTGRSQSFDLARINLKTNTIDKLNNFNAQ